MTVPIPTRTAPTVLLVDDEPANLQVLRQILQPHYRLLFAKDGAKALELCRRQPPDLIVLDVMMPEMDGYEVCRRLKADFDTCDIPVVFLSGLTSLEDRMAAYDAGGEVNGAIALVLAGAASLIAYVAFCLLLRVDELRSVRQMFKKRKEL